MFLKKKPSKNDFPFFLHFFIMIKISMLASSSVPFFSVTYSPSEGGSLPLYVETVLPEALPSKLGNAPYSGIQDREISQGIELPDSCLWSSF